MLLSVNQKFALPKKTNLTMEFDFTSLRLPLFPSAAKWTYVPFRRQGQAEIAEKERDIYNNMFL
jgi:hypothetical protein